MPSGAANAFLTYRPLLGGACIVNEAVGEIGTAGLIAVSDDGERWIVSCYHVLCRRIGDFPPGAVEPIYQPYRRLAASPVAYVDGSRANKAMDVAAAKVVDKAARGRVLGMGALADPTDPKEGMRVLKSGAKTGVTEGWVKSVTSDEVRVVIPPGYGSGYELADPGDSGSIWIDAESGAPVAMHQRGEVNVEEAVGRPIIQVLDELRLKVAPDTV